MPWRRLWTPRPREGDERLMTCGEFRAWKRRATLAFVFLTVVSTGAAWLAQRASDNADTGLREAGQQTIFTACSERIEGRLVIAQGFDQLRRLAVRPPKTAQDRRDVRDFLERTQAPIDTLLGLAAGHPLHSDPAKPLDGSLNVARIDGLARCRRQAAAFRRDHRDAFGG